MIASSTPRTSTGSFTLRVSRADFAPLAAHLKQDATCEQFALVLCSQAKTAAGKMLIVESIALPHRRDLAHQHAGGVAPTHRFQSLVYALADQARRSILDVHTHPHQQVPRFSATDRREWARTCEYVLNRFPSPMTAAMVVFNDSLTGFDGLAFDRVSRRALPIARLEILGRDTKIWVRAHENSTAEGADPQYGRQLLLPGWDQTTIARQRIAIVGGGGNGAQLFQSLVGIGAGSEGWIAMIDPDEIEESNLPRNPYACSEHVGAPKVTVAAQYAGRKNPRLPFYPYPCSVTDPAASDRLTAATLLFGAGDNDGVRHVCNEKAIRYRIPYIDLGCDIIAEEGGLTAGGQVRVVMPGENACLVCCGGYNSSDAARELADDATLAELAERGYAQGHEALAAPSIANLNGATAQLAMAAFLAVVHGKRFGDWDYAHFDQLTARTITANTTRHDDCPLCGRSGVLGAGDESTEPDDVPPQGWINISSHSGKSEIAVGTTSVPSMTTPPCVTASTTSARSQKRHPFV